MRPASGHSLENLAGITLPAENRFAVGSHQRLSVLILLRNSGLPKVLLSQNIDGQLGPLLRNINIV
jgi:hypothetical protein